MCNTIIKGRIFYTSSCQEKPQIFPTFLVRTFWKMYSLLLMWMIFVVKGDLAWAWDTIGAGSVGTLDAGWHLTSVPFSGDLFGKANDWPLLGVGASKGATSTLSNTTRGGGDVAGPGRRRRRAIAPSDAYAARLGAVADLLPDYGSGSLEEERAAEAPSEAPVRRRRQASPEPLKSTAVAPAVNLTWITTAIQQYSSPPSSSTALSVTRTPSLTPPPSASSPSPTPSTSLVADGSSSQTTLPFTTGTSFSMLESAASQASSLNDLLTMRVSSLPPPPAAPQVPQDPLVYAQSIPLLMLPTASSSTAAPVSQQGEATFPPASPASPASSAPLIPPVPPSPPSLLGPPAPPAAFNVMSSVLRLDAGHIQPPPLPQIPNPPDWIAPASSPPQPSANPKFAMEPFSFAVNFGGSGSGGSNAIDSSAALARSGADRQGHGSFSRMHQAAVKEGGVSIDLLARKVGAKEANDGATSDVDNEGDIGVSSDSSTASESSQTSLQTPARGDPDDFSFMDEGGVELLRRNLLFDSSNRVRSARNQEAMCRDSSSTSCPYLDPTDLRHRLKRAESGSEKHSKHKMTGQFVVPAKSVRTVQLTKGGIKVAGKEVHSSPAAHDRKAGKASHTTSSSRFPKGKAGSRASKPHNKVLQSYRTKQVNGGVAHADKGPKALKSFKKIQASGATGSSRVSKIDRASEPFGLPHVQAAKSAGSSHGRSSPAGKSGWLLHSSKSYLMSKASASPYGSKSVLYGRRSGSSGSAKAFQGAKFVGPNHSAKVGGGLSHAESMSHFARADHDSEGIHETLVLHNDRGVKAQAQQLALALQAAKTVKGSPGFSASKSLQEGDHERSLARLRRRQWLGLEPRSEAGEGDAQLDSDAGEGEDEDPSEEEIHEQEKMPLTRLRAERRRPAVPIPDEPMETEGEHEASLDGGSNESVENKDAVNSRALSFPNLQDGFENGAALDSEDASFQGVSRSSKRIAVASNAQDVQRDNPTPIDAIPDIIAAAPQMKRVVSLGNNVYPTVLVDVPPKAVVSVMRDNVPSETNEADVDSEVDFEPETKHVIAPARGILGPSGAAAPAVQSIRKVANKDVENTPFLQVSTKTDDPASHVAISEHLMHIGLARQSEPVGSLVIVGPDQSARSVESVDAVGPAVPVESAVPAGSVGPVESAWPVRSAGPARPVGPDVPVGRAEPALFSGPRGPAGSLRSSSSALSADSALPSDIAEHLPIPATALPSHDNRRVKGAVPLKDLSVAAVSAHARMEPVLPEGEAVAPQKEISNGFGPPDVFLLTGSPVPEEETSDQSTRRSNEEETELVRGLVAATVQNVLQQTGRKSMASEEDKGFVEVESPLSGNGWAEKGAAVGSVPSLFTAAEVVPAAGSAVVSETVPAVASAAVPAAVQVQPSLSPTLHPQFRVSETVSPGPTPGVYVLWRLTTENHERVARPIAALAPLIPFQTNTAPPPRQYESRPCQGETVPPTNSPPVSVYSSTAQCAPRARSGAGVGAPPFVIPGPFSGPIAERFKTRAPESFVRPETLRSPGLASRGSPNCTSTRICAPTSLAPAPAHRLSPALPAVPKAVTDPSDKRMLRIVVRMKSDDRDSDCGSYRGRANPAARGPGTRTTAGAEINRAVPAKLPRHGAQWLVKAMAPAVGVALAAESSSEAVELRGLMLARRRSPVVLVPVAADGAEALSDKSGDREDRRDSNAEFLENNGEEEEAEQLVKSEKTKLKRRMLRHVDSQEEQVHEALNVGRNVEVKELNNVDGVSNEGQVDSVAKEILFGHENGVINEKYPGNSGGMAIQGVADDVRSTDNVGIIGLVEGDGGTERLEVTEGPRNSGEVGGVGEAVSVRRPDDLGRIENIGGDGDRGTYSASEIGRIKNTEGVKATGNVKGIGNVENTRGIKGFGDVGSPGDVGGTANGQVGVTDGEADSGSIEDTESIGYTRGIGSAGDVGDTGSIGDTDKVRDTGSADDTGSVGDIESAEDTSSVGDTGNAEDADSVGDTGSAEDTGSVGDTSSAGAVTSVGDNGSVGGTGDVGGNGVGNIGGVEGTNNIGNNRKPISAGDTGDVRGTGRFGGIGGVRNSHGLAHAPIVGDLGPFGSAGVTAGSCGPGASCSSITHECSSPCGGGTTEKMRPEDESKGAAELNEKQDLQKALAGDLASRIVESVLHKAQREGQVQHHFVLSPSGSGEATAVLDAERRKLLREQAVRQQTQEEVLKEVLELLDGMAQQSGREQACTRLSPELHGFLLWLLQRGPGDGAAPGEDDPLNPYAYGKGGVPPEERPPGSFLFRTTPPAAHATLSAAPAPARRHPQKTPAAAFDDGEAAYFRTKAHAALSNISDASRLAELDERERSLRQMLNVLQRGALRGATPAPSAPEPDAEPGRPQRAVQPAWLETAKAEEELWVAKAQRPSSLREQDKSSARERGRRENADAARDPPERVIDPSAPSRTSIGADVTGVGVGNEGDRARPSKKHAHRRRRRLKARRRRRGGPHWPTDEYRRLEALAAKMRGVRL